MRVWISLREALDALAHQPAVLITVLATRGSVPRGPGTCMLVSATACVGTIGGGHLEYQAMAHARRLLAGQAQALSVLHVLGPSLGQCCGGTVELGFECVGPAQTPRLQAVLQPAGRPVALFGGGHVGRALVNALAPLPFVLRWIDSRDEIFPSQLPPGVQCEHSSPVHAALADLQPGSAVLIMSFSHAEDLDIVIACLRRLRQSDDLPFVGLIGSKTKWATFGHRLRERGFTDSEIGRITCPIGLPGIEGKEPEVIAASVAAQLLQLGLARP